jgi:hypothetical protein
LTVCFSGDAAERLHIGGKFDECGELEDYRMAHDFLSGRYPLVEIDIRIDTAMVAAERLIKTDWARARVPVIARALYERSTLTGEEMTRATIGYQLVMINSGNLLVRLHRILRAHVTLPFFTQSETSRRPPRKQSCQ